MSYKAATKRPEFEAALAYLRSDAVLVVWKRDAPATDTANT